MKRDPSAPIEAAKVHPVPFPFLRVSRIMYQFMGHGICETFNKQSALVGRDGGATDDPQIIAQQSLRMLRSLNFDPEELRGIGIQIQKLEKTTANSAAQVTGQSLIPFKFRDGQTSKGNPNSKGKEREKRPITSWSAPVQPNPIVISPDDPPAEIHLPPPPTGISIIAGAAETEVEQTPTTALVRQPTGSLILDLPSFSQVDMSVFEALPEDVRRELEAEYSRRSAPPQAAVQAAAMPTTVETADAVAGPSRLPAPAKRVAWGDMVPKNSKRIAQQLAPKRGGAAVPRKDPWEALNKWLEKPKKFKGTRVGPSHVVYDASPNELRSLGIDPEVFNLLPPEIRREQLSGAKIAIETGVLPILTDKSKVVIKPKKTMVIRYPRLPPPKAKYLPQPILKMPGEKKGHRVSYTDANDIQGLVEKWVTGFKQHPPNQKDVERFSRWLLSCMDSNSAGDAGMEKAMKVMKWWLFLLRRNWGWLEGIESLTWTMMNSTGKRKMDRSTRGSGRGRLARLGGSHF
jgi:DNA repair protein REV1